MLLNGTSDDLGQMHHNLGLIMLGGMVIYISTFKAEVGRKLQPPSSLQPTPLFIYTYGFSFLLVVSGFMTSELAGTFAIFLYINLQQSQVVKKENNKKRYRDIPPSPEDHLHCRRHHLSQRRGSSRCENNSRENSPHASTSRGQLTNTTLTLSESMKDLSYFNFPFSRDATCNTLSTSADMGLDYPREYPREYSREFSYETLRRTTPV
uniref:Voltage-dependent calcium channel gamma-5 subunit n=1 Tax=Strigamia maritima TaxID=126957 RepID=T1IXT8_STRMM